MKKFDTLLDRIAETLKYRELLRALLGSALGTFVGVTIASAKARIDYTIILFASFGCLGGACFGYIYSNVKDAYKQYRKNRIYNKKRILLDTTKEFLGNIYRLMLLEGYLDDTNLSPEIAEEVALVTQLIEDMGYTVNPDTNEIELVQHGLMRRLMNDDISIEDATEEICQRFQSVEDLFDR